MLTIPYMHVIAALIEREGGFVDHPSDKGGPTMYGITEAVARREGYAGDMRAMPVDFAQVVYLRRYVIGPGFGLLNDPSPRIAAEVIDTGVNMGVTVAATFLQRWLNAFNRQGRDYPDLAVDGAVGGRTITALKAFLSCRGAEGEKVLLVALNSSQAHRYMELGEARAANEDFLFGWVARRVADQMPGVAP